MEKNLGDYILNVCKTLNKHHIEYMIVGGTAVAFYGYYRTSINQAGIAAEKPDLDFWYNPSYKNYFNLLNALEDLGVDVAEFKKEQVPDPKKSFFKYEFENFTIDFLPQLKARFNFRTCFLKREVILIGQTEIPILHYED